MPADKRIREANGQRLDYTCENWGFMTNINKGYRHGRCPARGSVFRAPLAGSQAQGELSLWLEHVIVKRNSDEVYWLMWYKDGYPSIPMSGILRRVDIANMQRLLASFIP